MQETQVVLLVWEDASLTFAKRALKTGQRSIWSFHLVPIKMNHGHIRRVSLLISTSHHLVVGWGRHKEPSGTTKVSLEQGNHKLWKNTCCHIGTQTYSNNLAISNNLQVCSCFLPYLQWIFNCHDAERLNKNGELPLGVPSIDLSRVKSLCLDVFGLFTSRNQKDSHRHCDSKVQMGVSKNRGTPKSSILIGFSIINHPFWGTPIFGNTQICPNRWPPSHLAWTELPDHRNLQPQRGNVPPWRGSKSQQKRWHMSGK